MSLTMTLKPRISEKAYALSQTGNVYVFQVPTDANKMMIAEAVSAQFNVTVTNVNIVVAKGKVKTTYRKRGGRSVGTRSDVKKAYVTLKAGDHIAIFANDEDEKAEAKSKGSTKATAGKDKK